MRVRTGVVLDKDGGALGKMLPVLQGSASAARSPAASSTCRGSTPTTSSGSTCARSTTRAGRGAVNATAPEPVTNKAFSKALGRALHRPAIAPVPAFAIQLLYGDMAEIVTKGQNAVPRRTLELGYRHAHPDLDEALRSALRSD